MEQMKERSVVGIAAKIGALLFVLWGVLHIWVGFEGIHQYFAGDTKSMWSFLIGGANAPRAAFQHTTDALTAHAQAQLILNFCMDVGGYGVLGLFVGWMIWKRASWVGYAIGLIVIGIGALAFLFLMVTPGIMSLNSMRPAFSVMIGTL